MSNRRTLKAVPDPDLPFLTVAQAHRLRSMMRRGLAARGVVVTVHGDHLVTPEGATLGLWNVAALCKGSSPDEASWRRVVQEHIERLMYGMVGGDPFAGLTDADVQTRTYARLWPEPALPDYDVPQVPFAPGLVEVLCLDVPGGAALFNADEVTGHGGWDRLHAFGRTNLAARPFEEMELVTGPAGGHWFALYGDLYTASKALLLPGLLPEIRHDVPQLADAGMGWLVSVPNRNQVCWHMIQDGEVLLTLGGLSQHAPMAFNDAPGQLSPHVFWWSGQEYRQVTTVDAQGRLRLGSDPDFDPLVFRLLDAA